MSENGGSQRPYGFGGPVASWHELEPPLQSVSGKGDARVLRIPGEATPDEPFLRLPKGSYDLIEVHLTESLGRVEGVLHQVASALKPSGTCLLEVENSQAPRSLRLALEGRGGALDPQGSVSDPSQKLPLMRILMAAEATGLTVRDCVRVPSFPGDVDPAFAERLFDLGFFPLDYISGVPPWKHWVVCDNAEVSAGTVIVSSGTDSAQGATVQCLRTFLPSDWEIVCCSGPDEVVAFNRAVPRSCGELIWFLRAGATVDADLFKRLEAATIRSPAAPGCDGKLSNPGDVSGLMLTRKDLIAVGPFPEEWQSPQVAYEDWGILLESKTRRPRAEPGRFETPPPKAAELQVVEDEGQRLLQRWSALPSTEQRLEGDRQGDSEQLVEAVRDRPRITLCMITKNEERFLGRCLESAAPAVDEIIVVDTGSSDRTVEIAESHGAKVLHSAWTDDFSAPRNEALAAATGDWILVLDADETLVEGGGERIRELVCHPKVSGYHLVFRNLYSKGKSLGVLMVRLFRKLPGVRYEMRIHEQVTPSLARASSASDMLLAISDVEVIHEGYTDELMSERSKNERNERLFKLQLHDQPDDIYTRYKYGDFLRRVPGRNRDARRYLDETLEMILQQPPSALRELPYAGEVAALCALENAREDRMAEAVEIVDTALRQFTPTPNLNYIAASLALATGRNDAAIAYYRRCLAFHGEVLVVPIQEGITSYVSLAGIAQAYLQKGDRLRARRLLERSIAMHSEYDVSHMTLSKLHFEEGDVPGALTVLTDYLSLNPDSAGVCHQATLILKTMGLTEQARQMGERTLKLMDEEAMEYESESVRRTLATLC